MAFIDFTAQGPNDTNPPDVPPQGPVPPTPPTIKRPPSNSGINNIGKGNPQLTDEEDDETLIEELCINYNDKYKDADPILFRDTVISQVLATLIAKKKANALLVGPAGTGKTAIAGWIAHLIASGDPRIPAKLKKSTIYELPLSNVVAGASLVGELEGKLKRIVKWFLDPKNDAILFIDEIHQLTGRNEIYGKIAQILKPDLARGLRVIGATTTQEAQALAADPAFSRRFTRIIVDELTRDQTVEILRSAKSSYVTHYKGAVAVPDEILPSVAAIADTNHQPGNHRPDTALTLLDRAIGEVIVERASLEATFANTQDPDLKLALGAQIMNTPQVPLTEEALRHTALRLMTGNAKKHRLQKGELESALSPILGQKKALAKIRSAIERWAWSPFPRTRPLTLLLCGDSGVGKTEVANILSETLCEQAPIALNMSEYIEGNAINRIIGAPAGYVGYDTAGELPLDKLESNPFQLILLDEFEKGSKEVQRLFMGAFETGTIETSRGKTIDFTHAIICATTNAAHAGYRRSALGFGEPSEKNESTSLTESLKTAFDVELLNRFDVLCEFEPIDKSTYRDIVKAAWKREAALAKSEGLSETSLIPDEIDSETLERLVNETYNKDLGARPAKRAVRDEIERIVIDQMHGSSI